MANTIQNAVAFSLSLQTLGRSVTLDFADKSFLQSRSIAGIPYDAVGSMRLRADASGAPRGSHTSVLLVLLCLKRESSRVCSPFPTPNPLFSLSTCSKWPSVMAQRARDDGISMLHIASSGCNNHLVESESLHMACHSHTHEHDHCCEHRSTRSSASDASTVKPLVRHLKHENKRPFSRGKLDKQRSSITLSVHRSLAQPAGRTRPMTDQQAILPKQADQKPPI